MHKVHAEVVRYARDGYHILFVGHHHHDEALGTVGEAPDHITIVESADEAEALAFPPQPPSLVYSDVLPCDAFFRLMLRNCIKRLTPATIRPNPALKGRSGGADANRTVCGRTRIEVQKSHRIVAFPHTVRLASAPPDLPFRAGATAIFFTVFYR